MSFGGVFLGVLAGGGVQQAGTPELGHLLRHGAALVPVLVVADHVQPDVGPVEAVDQDQRVLHVQALLDFVADRGRGGGGEADDRRVAQLPADLAQAQVVGPEVVAPGGDAVGLVHHEQRDVQGREPVHGFGLGQLFRGQEEEHGVAALGGFPGVVHLGVAAAGVDGDGGLTAQRLQQAVQLVLLQGDQRGDHDGGTGRALLAAVAAFRLRCSCSAATW